MGKEIKRENNTNSPSTSSHSLEGFEDPAEEEKVVDEAVNNALKNKPPESIGPDHQLSAEELKRNAKTRDLMNRQERPRTSSEKSLSSNRSSFLFNSLASNMSIDSLNKEEKSVSPMVKPLSISIINGRLEGNIDPSGDRELHHLFMNRSNEQKLADFQDALRVLREQYTQEQLHSSKTQNISQTFLQAINDEARNIPTKDLPYLTEEIHRSLFKINNQDHPVNHINNPDDPNDKPGANTRRGLALSKEITDFKWGKFIGGIGMLVLGGVLVTAAVLTLMASFGSAAPLSAVLMGLGIHAATPAAITAIVGITSVSTLTPVAAVVAGGSGIVGAAGARYVAKGLYNALKAVTDKVIPATAPEIIRPANKIIREEYRKLFLFKPAEEKKSKTSSETEQQLKNQPGSGKKK